MLAHVDFGLVDIIPRESEPRQSKLVKQGMIMIDSYERAWKVC